MLNCTVKFCGGCNPHYDRGAAYKTIVNSVSDFASFSLPQDGVKYDVLLIIRGCTQCPYLYEEVDADHRIICVSEQDAKNAPDKLRGIFSAQ